MVEAIDIKDSFAPAKFGTIGSLLNVIIPIIIIVASGVLLAMLVMGAFTVLTAGGDPEKIKKAQHTITYAVFGFAIIILSYFIVKLISYITGINVPL